MSITTNLNHAHVIIWLRIAGRDTLLFPMVLDSMLIETQFKNALRFYLIRCLSLSPFLDNPGREHRKATKQGPINTLNIEQKNRRPIVTQPSTQDHNMRI